MFKSFLSFSFLLFSLAAHSAILDLGTITRDTSTGLDWLDVTETRGVSYNQMLTQMEVGGIYHGWRYATPQEFDRLIQNFGYVAINSDCSSGFAYCDDVYSSESTVVDKIIRTLGDTYDAYLDTTNDFLNVGPNGAGYVYGLLASNTLNPNYLYHDAGMVADWNLITRARGEYYNNGYDIVSTIHGSFLNNSTSPAAGSFLVAPSPVPLPTALLFFVSAFVCLIKKITKNFQATRF